MAIASARLVWSVLRKLLLFYSERDTMGINEADKEEAEKASTEPTTGVTSRYASIHRAVKGAVDMRAQCYAKRI
ncbi:unnamed protein product, partial [Iphiclides podalirius]